MLLLPVSLAHADVQIAAAARGVQIGNFKRTRRHITLINHVAVLPDHDLRVSARNPAHHRRVALHTVRQNVIFRSQLPAAELYAVEHLAGRCAVAQSQAALQRNNIALQIGID